MSIAIISSPDKWSSVYRPIRFTLRSDRLPNARAGESFIPILSITQDATGVRVLIATQFGTTDLQRGEAITIANTTNGLYVGQYRVLQTGTSAGNLFAYIDTAYVGDDFGGTASRYYDDLTAVVTVQFLHTLTQVTFNLRPVNDEFVLDMADAAARQFKRLFDTLEPSLTWGSNSDSRTSIAQEYVVNAYERWTSWTDGIPSVSDSRLEEGGAPSLKGFRAVNMVQPYHKEEASGINVDWSTDIGTVFPMQGGQTLRRFLTWSRHQDRKASDDDTFFVSFLCEPAQARQLRVFITTYAENGTAITSVSTALFDAYLANTVAVGPDVIPPGTINAFTAYYTVRILDVGGNVLSEELRINMDRECGEVNRRVWWRNKLGGLDQYTFKGRETEQVGVDRDNLRRLSPDLISARFTGTWRDRTHMAKPIRRKRLSTSLIPVDSVRYLAEDCFESADHATIVRAGWWTNMVLDAGDSAPYGTANINQRIVLDYAYGMDNLSQYA